MAKIPFATEAYSTGNELWPSSGRHILGSCTEDTIVVYQAYSKSIGEWVAEHQTFIGCPGYSLERMTWIKPNFLWMMYRSGWGTKTNQECTLALTVKLEGFRQLLKLSKKHDKDENFIEKKGEGGEGEFEGCCDPNDVRIQWDPDHDPFGAKTERRAIQLGIRGKTLRKFLEDWVVSIADITDFVKCQYLHVQNIQLDQLLVPIQRVYEIKDKELRLHIGL